MSDWGSWVGRVETRMDVLDTGLAARWLATLDREGSKDGIMPQGIHWVLCLRDAPTSKLGGDGYPLQDSRPDPFLPTERMSRRFWVSSKIEFVAPLKVGDAIMRTYKILSVTSKPGNSDEFLLVEIEVRTNNQNGVAVIEVQTIVYRGPPPLGEMPLQISVAQVGFDLTSWDVCHIIIPTELMLSHFSALTFNSHRVHHDLSYVTEEEGCRGLIVHGLLIASKLMQLAQAELGENALKHFYFRDVSPAICGEALQLVIRRKAEAIELGAFASDGREVMAATATWKD